MVHLHRRGKRFIRDSLRQHTGISGHASIVNENVDATETRRCHLHECFHLRGIADITATASCPADLNLWQKPLSFSSDARNLGLRANGEVQSRQGEAVLILGIYVPDGCIGLLELCLTQFDNGTQAELITAFSQA